MEIEYALGTKEGSFWQGQKAKNVFISDVVSPGMYISYTWRAQNANINKTFFCQSKFTIDSDIGIMTIMLT